MLTTVIAGRVYDFSHVVGRNAASGNGFTNPQSLASASGGVVYVLSRGAAGDGASRISKVFVGGFREEEVLAEFCRAGTGDGEALRPSGVAVDAQGNVHVASDWLNRIAIFDADGNFLSHWGTHGSGAGEFDGVAGLAFDPDDNLFAVDANNHRIQKFTKAGQHLASWGSRGRGAGEFDTPWGITVDAEGAVYVADWKNHRVQKFSNDGAYLAQFGQGGDDPQDLNHPADVAVDAEGDVYVADWGNHKVRIYDPEGALLASLIGDAQELSKWAKAALDANPDMVKMRRRAKSLEPEWRFYHPAAVAYDTEQERLIVADTHRARLQIYLKDKNYAEPQFNL